MRRLDLGSSINSSSSGSDTPDKMLGSVGSSAAASPFLSSQGKMTPVPGEGDERARAEGSSAAYHLATRGYGSIMAGKGKGEWGTTRVGMEQESEEGKWEESVKGEEKGEGRGVKLVDGSVGFGGGDDPGDEEGVHTDHQQHAEGLDEDIRRPLSRKLPVPARWLNPYRCNEH